MRLVFYSLFIFMLMGAYSQVYHLLSRHFDDEKYLRRQVAELKQDLVHEQAQRRWAEYQHRLFESQVVSVLPEVIQRDPEKKKYYALRNLASVVDQAPTSLWTEFHNLQFDRAKRAFRRKGYPESIELLETIIRRFPDSVHIAEAHFLLAESYYHVEKQQRFVYIVGEMVEHFPGSDLTGFILLRLAQVFEKNDRHRDALDIYELVANSFEHRVLRRQAQKNRQRLTL